MSLRMRPAGTTLPVSHQKFVPDYILVIFTLNFLSNKHCVYDLAASNYHFLFGFIII